MNTGGESLTKWEYWWLPFDFVPRDMDEVDKLGKAGWELINIIQYSVGKRGEGQIYYCAVLKRVKLEKPPKEVIVTCHNSACGWRSMVNIKDKVAICPICYTQFPIEEYLKSLKKGDKS